MVQEGDSPQAEQRHHEIINSLNKQDDRLSELVTEMRTLSTEMRTLGTQIVQVMTNKVPEGYLPLDVHRQAMSQLGELHSQAMQQLQQAHKESTKSLNRSWTWVLVAALTLLKLGPAAQKAVEHAVLDSGDSPFPPARTAEP